MENKDLISFSSEHYNYYFQPNSLAERDIVSIANGQERCFLDIVSFLEVIPDYKFEYYLLDSPEAVGKLYGDNQPCNGFAKYPNEIYAVYNKEVKCIGYHEDAHLVSNLINRPHSTFIVEGLAMYFDQSWWGKPNGEWVDNFLKSKKYISIFQLLHNRDFFDHPCEITYPIAGAFTEYLIELSKSKYLSLYRYTGKNITAEIERIYDKKISDLEADFIAQISN